MTDGQAKRTRVPTYLAVPAVAAALAVSILGWLRYESARHVVSAGFVFDDVMFEVPAQMAQRLGGALSNDEQERIAAISYSELVHAYSGLRIEFSDRRDALYVVACSRSCRTNRRAARSPDLMFWRHWAAAAS